MEELALARVLEECLQEIEQGETDLNRLLGRYPEAEEEIRPLLKIAQRLRTLRSAGAPLTSEFRDELRVLLMTNHASG